MSRYLLDTDIITLYQWQHPAVCSNVQKHTTDDICVSVISIEEQLTGWYSLVRRTKAPDKLAVAYQRLTDNVGFWTRFTILSFSQRAILLYLDLKKMKLRMRLMTFALPRLLSIIQPRSSAVISVTFSESLV